MSRLPWSLLSLNGIGNVTEDISDTKRFYLTKIEKASSDMGFNTEIGISTLRGNATSNDANISVADIFEFVKKHDVRGQYKNKDTGWVINSSSIGYDETISHSGKDKKSVIAMQNIDKIIENAVLLDTEVSEYGRGKKSIYTAFMHKFYAFVNIDGKTYIAKMAVDESHSPGQNDTIKKFYHVRSIEIEAALSVGIGNSHTPIMERTASNYTISDLYSLVKRFVKDFTPAREVNPLLLNEDGTPKVWYHQTDSKISEFDLDKQTNSMYDSETPNGIFLKSSDKDIGLQGKSQMNLCPAVSNILQFKNREEAKALRDCDRMCRSRGFFYLRK